MKVMNTWNSRMEDIQKTLENQKAFEHFANRAGSKLFELFLDNKDMRKLLQDGLMQQDEMLILRLIEEDLSACEDIRIEMRNR